MLKNIIKDKNAFTLAELIIVMVITGILLGVGILAISHSSAQSNLKKARLLLAEDLRKVQNYSMSGYAYNGTVPDAYGIYFASPTTYYFFYDLNDNDAWDSGETIETRTLANNVELDFASFSPTVCNSSYGCSVVSRIPEGQFCYDDDNSSKSDSNCSADIVTIVLKIDDLSDNVKINTFSGNVSY